MKRRMRKAFMTMDAIAGIMLLVALAAALAMAATLRQRNADHLADQRTATRIAQQALVSAKPPSDFPDAKVTFTRSGKKIGNKEWTEVTVTLRGRTATLAGLAPSASEGTR